MSGRGADHAFECTAVPELGAAPLAMVRHGGTAAQVSGIEQPITVDMQLFEWDQTYINPLVPCCGTDDPLIEQNRALRQSLQENGIGHEWAEGPGGHEWAYWREQLPDAMRFLVHVLSDPCSR